MAKGKDTLAEIAAGLEEESRNLRIQGMDILADMCRDYAKRIIEAGTKLDADAWNAGYDYALAHWRRYSDDRMENAQDRP